MKLFQIMPCRLQGYKATLDGYNQTDKYLISYNDVCNGGSNIFTPSGIADHLGSFLYIPFLSDKLAISIDIIASLFFIGYGLICFLIAIFFFNKVKMNFKNKIYGNLSILTLFLINIFISDTYSFYGLTALALIPIWYYIFANDYKNKTRDIIIYSIISGIFIAFSETVRGQSGLFIIICIFIFYSFTSKEKKTLKIISIFILFIPLIVSKYFFNSIIQERNIFFDNKPKLLIELKERDIAVRNVRSIWHNAYFGLGFLSIEKKDFPKNNDTYAVNKAKELNPNIISFTKEYENLLMKEYFKFIKDYPLYFIKSLFAKLGVIFMYILLFFNFGILKINKYKFDEKIIFFFLPGILLNSLLGFAAEPDYSYLLGMFTFTSLTSVYLLEKKQINEAKN